MSWDVLILKLKGGKPPPKLAEDTEMLPLGDAQQVRDVVARVLPGVDWSDPEAGYFQEAGVSIEFGHRKEGVTTDLMLHVRGDANPVPTIVRLCKAQGWAAYDISGEAFMDLDAPSTKSWEEFQSFRDSVLTRGGLGVPGGAEPPWPLLGLGIIAGIVAFVRWRKQRLEE